MHFQSGMIRIGKYRYLAGCSQFKRGNAIPLNDYEAVLKAAGEPVRARILKLLHGGELCVCQLLDILGLSQSTISGHLAILKNAGLVRDRKQGRWAYYSLSDRMANQYAPPVMALLMGWLDDDPLVRADKRRLAALKAKTGKGCD